MLSPQTKQTLKRELKNKKFDPTNWSDPKNCNECGYVSDCYANFKYCPYTGKEKEDYYTKANKAACER